MRTTSLYVELESISAIDVYILMDTQIIGGNGHLDFYYTCFEFSVCLSFHGDVRLSYTIFDVYWVVQVGVLIDFL